MSGRPPRAEGDEARPGTAEESDDAFIERLARGIGRRGMAMPALLFLESVKPLNFVGSQFLYFANPIVGMFAPVPDLPRLARLLEERDSIERLVEAIEAWEEADGASTDDSPPTEPATKPPAGPPAGAPRGGDTRADGTPADDALRSQGGSPS